MRCGGAKPRSLAAAIACLALTAALSSPGIASGAPREEQQGSQILRELESGKLRCGDASPAEFELVGEYAMGRMFGSPAHHEAMGRRFSGCGGYGSPGWMMGGYAYNAAGDGDDDFDGPSAGAMVGMMAVLIAAVGLALFLLARWRPGSPQETLRRRYAEGELSTEEYQEHRRLLEGS
jgi:hypothetical protein